MVEYLEEQEFVTSQEYSKEFKIAERQARMDLSGLVQLDLLVKEGKALRTRYRLSPDIKKEKRQEISMKVKEHKGKRQDSPEDILCA
ncbi:hypothetical protein HQ545_08265 [Candidatus Woesearchaeota archaeon]|nr:hypothetical protein [Candidatus Woesearchaeota archaeon]